MRLCSSTRDRRVDKVNLWTVMSGWRCLDGDDCDFIYTVLLNRIKYAMRGGVGATFLGCARLSNALDCGGVLSVRIHLLNKRCPRSWPRHIHLAHHDM